MNGFHIILPVNENVFKKFKLEFDLIALRKKWGLAASHKNIIHSSLGKN